MIKESFHTVSCFFVFGYLQVFLRKVIASACLEKFCPNEASHGIVRDVSCND